MKSTVLEVYGRTLTKDTLRPQSEYLWCLIQKCRNLTGWNMRASNLHRARQSLLHQKKRASLYQRKYVLSVISAGVSLRVSKAGEARAQWWTEELGALLLPKSLRQNATAVWDCFVWSVENKAGVSKLSLLIISCIDSSMTNVWNKAVDQLIDGGHDLSFQILSGVQDGPLSWWHLKSEKYP